MFKEPVYIRLMQWKLIQVAFRAQAEISFNIGPQAVRLKVLKTFAVQA